MSPIELLWTAKNENFGRFWGNLQVLGRSSDFGKIFRFWENSQIFGKFSKFRKILRISENSQNFGKISDLVGLYQSGHVSSSH